VKGRTKCPKCEHEFVLDMEPDDKKHETTCPKCKNKFTIKPTSPPKDSDDECYWEEHGEPRKTILSARIIKTNKPTIATILLVCVFVIGVTTAVFSETFIETSLDVTSALGMGGNVEVYVKNETNVSLSNVYVKYNDKVDITDEKGFSSFQNVEPGIQTVEIILSGYKTIKKEILVTPFFTSSNEITMKEDDTTEKENITFDSRGCSLIILIFSVFALIGAVSCLNRKNYDVAIAGSLLGVFSIGFFMIGGIISIAAFAVIIVSRDEFRDGKKGKFF
jgi:DNA-directed RNA polymerase subunit RPC12/RpoP